MHLKGDKNMIMQKILLIEKIIKELIIVKHFSSLCNNFSYIQPTFVFHVQEGFHIFRDHFAAFLVTSSERT